MHIVMVKSANVLLCVGLLISSLCGAAYSQIGKSVNAGYQLSCHPSVNAPEIFPSHEGNRKTERNIGDPRGLSLLADRIIQGQPGKRQMLRGYIINNSGREVKNTEGAIDEARYFYVWSYQWACALYNNGKLN